MWVHGGNVKPDVLKTEQLGELRRRAEANQYLTASPTVLALLREIELLRAGLQRAGHAEHCAGQQCDCHWSLLRSDRTLGEP